jgi:hypothetical protein
VGNRFPTLRPLKRRGKAFRAGKACALVAGMKHTNGQLTKPAHRSRLGRVLGPANSLRRRLTTCASLFLLIGGGITYLAVEAMT